MSICRGAVCFRRTSVAQTAVSAYFNAGSSSQHALLVSINPHKRLHVVVSTHHIGLVERYNQQTTQQGSAGA